MNRQTNTRLRSALLALCAASWLGGSLLSAASIKELSTVFYGKIHAIGSSQPYLITEGELLWTIQRASGGEMVLRSQLHPLNDGEFSYRLQVPHAAMALGLQSADTALPLGLTGATHAHLHITIDGTPAKIVNEDRLTFETAVSKRGAVYRLDLQVEREATDTDGDGMPDWWEKRFGTDPQKPDGNADPDGDGHGNLAEFLAGTDPTSDGRVPRILTKRVAAYENGTAGVLIQVEDVDSSPRELRFELVRSPLLGQLQLRDLGPDEDVMEAEALSAGDAFTLEDVQNGRLVYTYPGEAFGLTPSFELRLRDEDENHPAVNADIDIEVFEASDEILEQLPEDGLALAEHSLFLDGLDVEENLRYRAYLLAREAEAIVWDLAAFEYPAILAAPSAMPDGPQAETEGSARRHVIIGSGKDDTLNGGIKRDVILGGEGDDILQGGPGADHFVYTTGNAGHDVILDFQLDEMDVIDLTPVLAGASNQLHDYVRLTEIEGEAQLDVDADGSGSGHHDFSITLAGLDFAQTKLTALVEGGHLRTGGKLLRPTIGLTASSHLITENDLDGVELTLSRRGDTSSELVVPLAFGGDAANGADYQAPPSVTFPPGVSSVNVSVTPLPDTLAENDETIEISLASSDDFRVDDTHSAVLTLQDLRILVGIEALNPLAETTIGTTGLFVIQRDAMLDRGVLVRLEIGGTARNGSDYDRLVEVVNFGPGETARLLEVTPMRDFIPANGADTVDVRVVPHEAYRIEGSGSARVTILGGETNFATWRARAFPRSMDSLESFATSDPGNLGVSVLARYGFGLDPRHPDLTRLPTVTLVEGRPLIKFRRAIVDDVEWTVETSHDLKQWAPGGASLVSSVEISDAIEKIYQMDPASDQFGQSYLRVRLDHKR